MKKLLTTLLSSMILSHGLTFAGETEKWSYTGHKGPEHWGELDEAFSACAKGKNQSPINLTEFIEAKLSPCEFDYGSQATEILNNGYTVQANIAPGSSLQFEKKDFELKQFHFHAPSENQINGKSYAMEAHLVHAAEDGQLAVIAVMFDEGAENETLARLWEEMPEHGGDRNMLTDPINAKELLPEDKDYYRFTGSLTTPPCSEGVHWLVMKQSVTASREQVEAFLRVMGHPNARPVQPVNARPVLK
jgi:carbonic anhydrase